MYAAPHFLKTHLASYFLILTLVVGFFLRLYQVGQIPTKGETADEYAWTFLGASLLQTGTPTSWSYFPYAEYDHRIIDGQYFPMVSPVMDHPPLFSLIPGAIQTLAGQPWDKPINLFWLRLPMVLLGTLNIWLLYRFCQTWMKLPATLLATALYAISPTVILGSRTILADNLLTTFFLLHLLLSNLPSNTRWKEIALVTLTLVNPLTKIAALAFSGAHAVIALTERRWKEVFWIISGTLFGVAALLLYASFFDLSKFLEIQVLQSSFRHTTFLTLLLAFFGQPKAVDTVFFDGIMIAAKLSFLVFLFIAPKIKHVQRMLVLTFSYIFFLGITIGETVQAPGSFAGHGSYGWYWYPLLPVFTATLGYVLYDAWEKNNRWAITGFGMFLILQLRLFILHIDGAQLGTGGVADWLVMVVFAALLGMNFLFEKWWRLAVLAGLILLILTSVGSILFFNPDVYFQEGSYFRMI